MSHKQRVSTIVALLILTALPAMAGGGLGITGSYWNTDQSGDNIGLGFLADVAFTNSPVDLEFRVAFIKGLDPGNRFPDFSIDATPVELGVSYNFNRGGVNPYIGGGIGYYVLDVNRVDGRANIQNENGLYGVGGVDIPIGGNWALLGEAMYRSVKAEVEGEGLADFDVLGVDLSGFSANVGFVWRW